MAGKHSSKFFTGIGRFMQGRYGADALSIFCLPLYAIFLLLSIFPHCRFFSIFALAVAAIAIFRSFSRNIPKRQKELQHFLNFTGKIKSFFRRKKRMFRERKTHKFFKCKKCHAVLRVPRGKGKIEITCPKCYTKMTKKT